MPPIAVVHGDDLDDGPPDGEEAAHADRVVILWSNLSEIGSRACREAWERRTQPTRPRMCRAHRRSIVVVMVKKIRTEVSTRRTVPIFSSSGRDTGPAEDAMIID